MSTENFSSFISLVLTMFKNVYVWMQSITIADVSLFTWLIGFVCFGVVVSVIHTFASVGGVSMSSVGLGIYEVSRSAKEKTERESYKTYKTNRMRKEAYDRRYRNGE